MKIISIYLKKILKIYLEEDKYIVCLSSGTSAIHLVLILVGIKQDDEVLCKSFTFLASANPIVYQRAKPIFIDNEKTLGIYALKL